MEEHLQTPMEMSTEVQLDNSYIKSLEEELNQVSKERSQYINKHLNLLVKCNMLESMLRYLIRCAFIDRLVYLFYPKKLLLDLKELQEELIEENKSFNI